MSLILPDQWVIIVLPNEHTKIVQLKATQWVDLSRYGKFMSEELFGCPLNMCYEISKEGKLTRFIPFETDQGPIDMVEDELTELLPQISHTSDQPTNQTIFDSNSSQKLSQAEILEIRDSGKSIVAELVQNSSSFEQKNSFSKIKYIQRKQKKFSRWMRVLPINTRNLCNHFIEREPYKIMDFRLDTLGQMLNVGNVQYGGKYLIMDDTKGLLTGAVMERTVPVDFEQKTTLLVAHEESHYCPHSLRMFNFNEEQMAVLQDIHIRDCLPINFEADQWINDVTDSERLKLYADKIEARRLKFVERQERRLSARRTLDEREFDSILLAVDPGAYTVESLISSWSPYLRNGGILVAYSTSKEALNPAFYEALIDERYTDVRITESFLRPYQTAEGRLHPMMTSNGHGGYLLSLIKVV